MAPKKGTCCVGTSPISLRRNTGDSTGNMIGSVEFYKSVNRLGKLKIPNPRRGNGNEAGGAEIADLFVLLTKIHHLAVRVSKFLSPLWGILVSVRISHQL